jgi:oxygen-dependent protoporphyrinogen oxidase
VTQPVQSGWSSARDCEIAVIGGGIAGLTAAWHLRDRDVLLLESAPRVGGRVRSEPRGDYWLNLGPHIFPGPESNLGRVVDELGLETTPIPGSLMGVCLNGRVVAGGRPELYPLRVRSSPAGRVSLARAGLLIRSGVREYLDLAHRHPGETAATVRQRLLAYRDDRTFAEFLGPLHPDADDLLRAAINRVSAEPEALSAGAGIAQFAATFNAAGSLYQRTLAGGTGVFIDQMEAMLGGRIVTHAVVGEVANTEHGVRVTIERPSGATTINARAAIVATPAFVTRRIVAALPPALEQALQSIRYGPYVVAGFLTGERAATPWDTIYALVVAAKSFNMFFNTVSIRRGQPERQPGGSLTVYGAASLGADLLEHSDEEVVESFVRDLRAVFPATDQLVEEVIVQRWPQGIPYSIPGRSSHQSTLERPLERIAFAGDYLGERGGMDTAATSGLEAAARVRALVERECAVAPSLS